MCDSALTIGICPQKFIGKLAAGLLLAAVIGLAGCGGDDDEASTAPAATTPVQTETTEPVPAETETEGGTETETETEEPMTETETGSPEDVPGGAGDEEPARTLALFTGRGGRIAPRLVRVPAFISIRVELRTGDGATYALRFGDTTLTAGGELNSQAKTFDGLRPGEALVGRPQGRGNRVRVEATAEPGP